MKTRIVKIGDAYYVCIPDALLELIGLSGEVEVEVQQQQLVIRPVRHPRQGWAEQFAEMAVRGEDTLLDGKVLNQSSWDEEEWEW